MDNNEKEESKKVRSKSVAEAAGKNIMYKDTWFLRNEFDVAMHCFENYPRYYKFFRNVRISVSLLCGGAMLYFSYKENLPAVLAFLIAMEIFLTLLSWKAAIDVPDDEGWIKSFCIKGKPFIEIEHSRYSGRFYALHFLFFGWLYFTFQFSLEPSLFHLALFDPLRDRSLNIFEVDFPVMTSVTLLMVCVLWFGLRINIVYPFVDLYQEKYRKKAGFVENIDSCR